MDDAEREERFAARKAREEATLAAEEPVEVDHEAVIESKKTQVQKEYAEMLADSEDENIEIDEEKMEELLDMVCQRDFMTPEEADEFLEERFEALQEIRVRPNKVRKQKGPEPDLYDRVLAEPRTAESKMESHWVVDQENHDLYFDNWEQRIARYPEGFRQYENYANYQIKYPGSSIADYTEHMNSQIEFADFLRLMRQAALEESRTDDWKHDNPIYSDEEEYTMEDIIFGELFEQEVRQQYDQVVQEKLLERKWFTWVDALDETLDMWHCGRNMYKMPVTNSYIPVRHTLM